MKCGLLGRKLAHSYSPQIHKLLAPYRYDLIEKEPEELEAFLKCADFTGLNVTAPYKKDVIAYLDELSTTAARLGAVNTIVRRDGRLIGHNTDYFGFQSLLQRTALQPAGKKCLVLGSGGASNTVCAVLEEMGGRVVVISRSGENHYHNLHLHADASIIVNTTPVGTYPNTQEMPVDLSLFPHLEGVLDVVYNPANTAFLQQAQNLGIPCANGLWMLVAQAKQASEWFSGTVINDGKIEYIYRVLRRQMENIILIGMPGCGKSTIGRMIADRTGKKFVDADEWIENLSGRSIEDILTNDGEDAFRTWETTVLQQLGKESSLVIATGGGCVTKAENYPLLHQNGQIIWISRDLAALRTDGRPLSRQYGVQHLYDSRKDLYAQFADHTVQNRSDPAVCVKEILEKLGYTP